MEFIDQASAFLSSSLFGYILKGALIYLGVLWFSMVIWVTRDIINRTNSVLFQTMVILMNIALPVFGLVLYLIIRPTKTLTEKYYEELEYNFLNEHEHEESCKRCEKRVKSDYLFCPHCEERLKQVCWSCKHTYLEDYAVCPYCGKKEEDNNRKPRSIKKKSSSKTKKKSTASSQK